MLPFPERDVTVSLDVPEADRRVGGDVTGGKNQDLNKCVESSDTPPPLPTYTSCDFLSCGGTYLPSGNAL